MSETIPFPLPFRSMPCPSHSPWGAIQDAHESAPGIWFISTAGHGGFLLSPERRAAMPQAMRDFPTFAGGNAYEEDNDAAIVILAFPTEFIPRQIQSALRTVRMTARFDSLAPAKRIGLRAIHDAYIAAVTAEPAQ